MRFAKVWELIRKSRLRLTRKKEKSETIIYEKNHRVPKVGRTGETVNEKRWEYILKKKYWNFFEKKRLELFKKHYPNPVTQEMIRREFGGKATVNVAESINEKFRHPPNHPEEGEPYRIEGEGEGYQIFHVAPRK